MKSSNEKLINTETFVTRPPLGSKDFYRKLAFGTLIS